MTLAPALEQQVFWLGDTLWNLYGDAKDRLFDANGLRLEQWKQEGRATLIKSGAGRTIYRVRLAGLDLYVKHFWATTRLSLLHQMIRQGRADKEFHLAHLLDECGVQTIKPVAFGERRRHGVLLESYLLTEAIPDGLTLYELIEQHILTGRVPFPPEARFRFAAELAKLTATIHQTGIEHRDLHEKNIVVRPMPDGTYRFYLLDLHELQIHRPLGWTRALKELGRMGRYFTLRTSTVDRLRFFKRYAELRGLAPDTIKSLARDAERVVLTSRAEFWRRRDTRPARKNLRIVRYETSSARAFAVEELAAETVYRLMADPDAPFDPDDGAVKHWWKIGRATRVAEVDLPAIRSGSALIYKQYYFKGWHESIAALFRRNQASRAWNCGASLLLRELPTPRPLLLIHRLRFGLPITSYLITERVPDSMTIDRYLDRYLAQLDPTRRQRGQRALLIAAARLLRKLHDRRVTHRDLKATNVLVSANEDIENPKLWLIDLDGVQTWQAVPEKQRIQNLTRFYVNFHQRSEISLSDRLRFLRIYLGRGFRDRLQWKRLWHTILQEAEKKIQRNQRLGRGLA